MPNALKIVKGRCNRIRISVVVVEGEGEGRG